MLKLCVKKYRTQNGLRQIDVANAINVDRSTVAKWEIGEAFPRVSILPELAKVLNCTVDELLSDDSEVQENDA